MAPNDDNTSHLAESQIDRQLAALRNEVQQMGHTRTDNGNSKSVRRIAEAIIIASLVSLGATVWLLRDAVNVLQTSQVFLQKQLDRVESRQDRADERINEVSGRALRGIQDGKDPYAPDKQ